MNRIYLCTGTFTFRNNRKNSSPKCTAAKLVVSANSSGHWGTQRRYNSHDHAHDIHMALAYAFYHFTNTALLRYALLSVVCTQSATATDWSKATGTSAARAQLFDAGL